MPDVLDGAAGETALRQRAGVFDRRREVFRVAGTDAATYLNGQASADFVALAPGAGAECLVLTPQGKLVAWGRALRVDAATFLISVDAGYAALAVEALERFKLRVDVTIELLPEIRVWGVFGPAADAAIEAAYGAVPPRELAGHVGVEERGVRLVRAGWGTFAGVDVVGDVVMPDAAPAVAQDVVDVLRAEVGWPRMGVDFDVSTIPHDAGLVQRAVSLDKGCYVGQELIERIHSRGHANRFVRRLDVQGADLPPLGTPVTLAGKDVGALTTGGFSHALGHPVGLALLRKEAGPGTAVLVGSAPATVVAV